MHLEGTAAVLVSARLDCLPQSRGLATLLLTEGPGQAAGALPAGSPSAGWAHAVLLVLDRVHSGPVQIDRVLTHKVEASHGVSNLFPVLVVQDA